MFSKIIIKSVVNILEKDGAKRSPKLIKRLINSDVISNPMFPSSSVPSFVSPPPSKFLGNFSGSDSSGSSMYFSCSPENYIDSCLFPAEMVAAFIKRFEAFLQSFHTNELIEKLLQVGILEQVLNNIHPNIVRICYRAIEAFNPQINLIYIQHFEDSLYSLDLYDLVMYLHKIGFIAKLEEFFAVGDKALATSTKKIVNEVDKNINKLTYVAPKHAEMDEWSESYKQWLFENANPHIPKTSDALMNRQEGIKRLLQYHNLFNSHEIEIFYQLNDVASTEETLYKAIAILDACLADKSYTVNKYTPCACFLIAHQFTTEGALGDDIVYIVNDTVLCTTTSSPLNPETFSKEKEKILNLIDFKNFSTLFDFVTEYSKDKHEEIRNLAGFISLLEIMMNPVSNLDVTAMKCIEMASRNEWNILHKVSSKIELFMKNKMKKEHYTVLKQTYVQTIFTLYIRKLHKIKPLGLSL